MRLLIVNADDFGYTTDVNEGIIEAHTRGILTAATLMANGDAFADAVRLARAHPDLDLGCHLVLVGGASLLSGRAYPRSVAQLLGELAAGRWDVTAEFRAQIERTLAAGIQPTHLDTHKHTHLFPAVLEPVARLAAEYRIPWVRRPFDLPLARATVSSMRRWVTSALGLLRPRFHQILEKHHCRVTDHFAGFGWTGSYRLEDFTWLAANLPLGLTEFMTHPGFCREPLQRAPTRLKQTREAELQVLVDPEARAALRREGITLTNYRRLLFRHPDEEGRTGTGGAVGNRH